MKKDLCYTIEEDGKLHKGRKKVQFGKTLSDDITDSEEELISQCNRMIMEDVLPLNKE